MAENEESVVGRSPPPRKTDVLFGPGTHWSTNACVNYGQGEGAYSRGFRHAAQLVAAQVCETEREQDTLIYPIVYLYRHTIEMALKFIIDDACELLDRTLNKNLLTHFSKL